MSLTGTFRSLHQSRHSTNIPAALNKTLTDFYIKSGIMFDPDEWLKKNPYHEASFDDSEEWMNK